MKAMKNKLKSQKGETLVELLAAILISALSVALLMSGVAASIQMIRKTDETDDRFYQALSAAENRETPVAEGVDAAPRVKVQEGEREVSRPVQVYGTEELYSYGVKATGP